MKEYEAVIVGAGFAGLCMLHHLRESGRSAVVFEAGADIGGTWYWNRYPGARCDVESLEYQFGFSDQIQRGWSWTERYATQPELFRYLCYVADKLELRRDIQFNARVISAIYDENAERWVVETEKGQRVSARYCVLATGPLSAARIPEFPGLEGFKGRWFHTGRWPADNVSFSGRRVGVIGTGSSGIQAIPIIAREASHVYVFQRTPNFSLPACNAKLDPDRVERAKDQFAENRARAKDTYSGTLLPVGETPGSQLSVEAQTAEYEQRWKLGGFAFLTTFADMLLDKRTNEVAAEFVREKIRQIVNDPKTADLLSPRDHPIGAKRICLDSGYFETFNRPNVTLVDVGSAPIEGFTSNALRAGGKEYTLDDVVFATGFDALTGALLNIDIQGRNGLSLRQKWSSGPRTYLGLGSAGFPNLFIIAGPGSPSVLANFIVAAEQHVEWIMDCIRFLEDRGVRSIEPAVDAEDAWVAHVNEVASATLYPQANSYYIGANVPGKPRVFMPYVGGFAAYRKKCELVAANGYEGFNLART